MGGKQPAQSLWTALVGGFWHLASRAAAEAWLRQRQAQEARAAVHLPCEK